MLERPRNKINFLISQIINCLCSYSISHSSKLNISIVMQFPQGLCQHLLRPSSKLVSIQTVVPKITVIPLPATCSMDISPSHSDGSLVSMDESMSTFDTVRSPEVEDIDDHESAAVDSIEKKA